MDSLFGTKFIDENGAEHGAEVISGFKLLVLVYTASWWGACKPSWDLETTQCFKP